MLWIHFRAKLYAISDALVRVGMIVLLIPIAYVLVVIDYAAKKSRHGRQMIELLLTKESILAQPRITIIMSCERCRTVHTLFMDEYRPITLCPACQNGK